jgi:hypothetical protein
MLKGVVIFGAGATCGYALAMRNQGPNAEIKEATADFIKSMRGILNDAWLDTKNEMKTSKEKVEEAKKTPEDTTPPTEPIIVEPVEPPPIPRDPGDPAA